MYCVRLVQLGYLQQQHLHQGGSSSWHSPGLHAQARIMVEREWQLEIQGELTKQRRIEAIDKLLSVLTLIVASVFGLQAIGLDGVPFVCRPDWLQT